MKVSNDGAERMVVGSEFQAFEAVVLNRRLPILKLELGITRRVVSVADLIVGVREQIKEFGDVWEARLLRAL